MHLGHFEWLQITSFTRQVIPVFVTVAEAAKFCGLFNNQAVLVPERVVDDKDVREEHGKPWNSYHVMVAVPDAVAYVT